MIRKNKKAFTLVELLAVIVILSIILVIAVPKVMDVISDSKKATLESAAKMIASSAEKAKVQNTILGNTETIKCDTVAKLNNIDYKDCNIEFDGNTALVTINGVGKFEGLNVCDGTKTSASATDKNCPVLASKYITKLLAQEEIKHNGLVQTEATYTNTNNEEVTVDAGIRYVGPLIGDNAVKNQVYFNCEETDGINVYGSKNYKYNEACEIWRIIGVFEVEDENRNKAQRIKIININSIFTASWDSSAETLNSGYGINQWGESEYTDGSVYAGADLMQLLNGYYVEKNNPEIVEDNKKECKYNIGSGQSDFAETCDTKVDELKDKKMKPLTSKALDMIDKTIWYTYATSTNAASEAYLQERGITNKYTGCKGTETTRCGSIIMNNEMLGLVGLMSVSDINYANGWLYNSSIFHWSITPCRYSSNSYYAWYSGSAGAHRDDVYDEYGVWPSVYLKTDIKIAGGNGDTEPYILK